MGLCVWLCVAPQPHNPMLWVGLCGCVLHTRGCLDLCVVVGNTQGVCCVHTRGPRGVVCEASCRFGLRVVVWVRTALFETRSAPKQGYHISPCLYRTRTPKSTPRTGVLLDTLYTTVKRPLGAAGLLRREADHQAAAAVPVAPPHQDALQGHRRGSASRSQKALRPWQVPAVRWRVETQYPTVHV